MGNFLLARGTAVGGDTIHFPALHTTTPRMPVEEIEVETILFDMDGVSTGVQPPSAHQQTLIDSTPAVNATWREFAEQHKLDINEVVRLAALVLASAHRAAPQLAWPPHGREPFALYPYTKGRRTRRGGEALREPDPRDRRAQPAKSALYGQGRGHDHCDAWRKAAAEPGAPSRAPPIAPITDHARLTRGATSTPSAGTPGPLSRAVRLRV